MRCLPFLAALPLVLSAQSPESDQRITQTLISEIQQLRLAIERSTLLNARTQLAISQLQIQESAVARVSSHYDDAKSRRSSIAHSRESLIGRIKEAEDRRSAPAVSPTERETLSRSISAMKQELEALTTMEQDMMAREGEAAGQLQTAQNAVADSRSRIAEMERALDTAIQQLLKQK